MFAILPVAFFFFAIAGRALAFNITVGNMLLQSNQILDFNFNVPPMTECNGNCTSAQTQIAGCADESCFCRSDIVASLRSCEQCMYASLIAANKPKPDIRAGSTPVLAAYAVSCLNAKIPLAKPQIALTIPPSWDGPSGIFVPIGGLVVTVGIGAVLGVSAITLVSTM